MYLPLDNFFHFNKTSVSNILVSFTGDQETADGHEQAGHGGAGQDAEPAAGGPGQDAQRAEGRPDKVTACRRGGCTNEVSNQVIINYCILN